jgi:adenosylcobinamide kinase / adenosylcobinamide-phosphate guanylyltransferase
MSLTFLVGGARSGKSFLAVEQAARSGLAVTFIATAPADVTNETTIDTEMHDRIARHRRERPSSWATIEEPLDLAGALTHAGGTFAIVDCLTLWASNVMWEGRTDDEIDTVTVESIDAARRVGAPVVVVSNEVGLGIHPDTELGRRYRDVLGRVNQRWAAAADTALFMVAGRALLLGDPATMLGADHPTARITGS